MPEPATSHEASLLEENHRLRMENALLRQKLDAMARQLFGKKSEQLNEAQMQLLFQELLAPGAGTGKRIKPGGY